MVGQEKNRYLEGREVLFCSYVSVMEDREVGKEVDRWGSGKEGRKALWLSRKFGTIHIW